jgi:hypothetical protein
MGRPPATAALTLLGSALLLAGQTAQPPVFRSGVELVDVAVVVVGEDGRFVPGLTAARSAGPMCSSTNCRAWRRTATTLDGVT